MRIANCTSSEGLRYRREDGSGSSDVAWHSKTAEGFIELGTNGAGREPKGVRASRRRGGGLRIRALRLDRDPLQESPANTLGAAKVVAEPEV
jgi:hypothetical protein